MKQPFCDRWPLVRRQLAAALAATGCMAACVLAATGTAAATTSPRLVQAPALAFFAPPRRNARAARLWLPA